ncbi:MAG: hypothetical protein AAFX87_14165 [Bacteroidota bacterium]
MQFGHQPDKNILSKPWQVIYTTSAHHQRNTKALERLELLSLKDVISLEASGYVLLGHYSGFILEFEGDTIVTIAEISEQVLEQLGRPEKTDSRVNFEHLFSEERSSSGRPILHSLPQIEFNFPFRGTTSIASFDQTICVSWDIEYGDAPDTYTVKISNIFDEPYDSIYTSEKFINLDLSKYPTEEGLVIWVHDKDKDTFHSPHAVYKIGAVDIYTPMDCNPKNAFKALEMAFLIEIGGRYDQAVPFYQLAASLSNRPIFRELLQYSLKRK